MKRKISFRKIGFVIECIARLESFAFFEAFNRESFKKSLEALWSEEGEEADNKVALYFLWFHNLLYILPCRAIKES